MKEIAEEPSLRAGRHRGRGRSPHARQVSDRGQSGQDVGLDPGEALTAAGRAHRGNPAQGLGYGDDEIAKIKASGAITAQEKGARAEAA